MRSVLLHLRIHFSFFLMPVFMFAVSQATETDTANLIISFVLLHFFVFPASNGYNSYHDRDTSSIGLIKHPPLVSKKLLYTVNIMDVAAVLSGLLISITFSLLLAGFIIMSRAYSYRKVRIKKYPVLSFIIVSVFQGGWVYAATMHAISLISFREIIASQEHVLGMLISTLFIGSVYPLTQIYQHDSDKRDGVLTISYKLGYIGTFIFSVILFTSAGILMYLLFAADNNVKLFVLFSLIMLPVFSFFLYWFYKVKTDITQANYTNTMRMNLITSCCMNVFFIILIFQ